jgi:GDP-L-fucose synthase
MKNAKIYVAGHTGLIGSAVVRKLLEKKYLNIITVNKKDLDLRNQKNVYQFLKNKKPDYVIMAAAKVGGIFANNEYRAEFIYDNLAMQNNIIHGSFINKINNLIFLGSSCIYPRETKQPIKESYLLTGKLEATNEPYAIAKIAGIKICESYNRQ